MATTPPRGAPRVLRFAFDVQCPYAYLASKRVRALAADASPPAQLDWYPVLLGGLYAATKAPQGKDGSATDLMAAAKRAINAQDLAREAARWRVPLRYNSRHPVKSVRAQRLLVSVREQAARARLTDALYDAYGQRDEDVGDDAVLLRAAMAASVAGIRTLQDVARAVESPLAKEELRANTDWASAHGAFGVPAFWVLGPGAAADAADERVFFGQDRTFFVARAAGVPSSHPLASPLRLTRTTPGDGAGKRLEFFHDFSSPWSYLGFTQIERVAREHGAELVLRPILLGAVFKSIGTANVPMFEMSEAKRSYMARDLEDWKRWWGGVALQFPDAFPVRTVAPLRVAIAEPRVTGAVYRAAWTQNQDIGDAHVLSRVLSQAGFDGPGLVARAASDAALKDALVANTSEAVKRGLCGVPTFSVNGGALVWGQDRIASVVEDELSSARHGAAVHEAGEERGARL